MWGGALGCLHLCFQPLFQRRRRRHVRLRALPLGLGGGALRLRTLHLQPRPGSRQLLLRNLHRIVVAGLIHERAVQRCLRQHHFVLGLDDVLPLLRRLERYGGASELIS